MGVLIALFKRVELRTNMEKTTLMVYVPGKIHTRQSWVVYNNRIKGLQEGGNGITKESSVTSAVQG